MGPAPQALLDVKVQTLIQPDSNQWDVSAVEAIIIPNHLEDVLALVPSKIQKPDSYAWLPNNSGLYSVKSGYWSVLEHKRRNVVANRLESFPWKREIWRLPTMPKICMFMWKALHDVVPSNDALNLHHVPVPLDCVRCGERETLSHILFYCSFAQETWRLVRTAPIISIVPNISIGDLFQVLGKCRNLPPCGLREPIYPWICWELWKARNMLVFTLQGCQPEEVYLRSIRGAKEWSEATCSTLEILSRVSPSFLPMASEALFICRSDAALDTSRHVIGLGWAFWSLSSEIIRQVSKCRVGIKSALVGEGLVLLDAMQDALELGFLKVVFASDSLVLISLLFGGGANLELQGVLHDIRALRSHFLVISFRYISRVENSVADLLAKTGLSFDT